MALTVGDSAPDFEADTTDGRISFHEWIGDSWAVLFSHPRDFTPVCSTELSYMASIKPEFDARDTKVVALSADTLANHRKWAQDIAAIGGVALNYPIIADPDNAIARIYGMLPPDADGSERITIHSATLRNVFVIGPDKIIRLVLIYPMSAGRNFDEVLRVIDSLQRTSEHAVSTPAQWQPGDDVIIAGSLSDEQAREKYPDGWGGARPYIRTVPDPAGEEPAQRRA